jgi:hypothetical protein
MRHWNKQPRRGGVDDSTRIAEMSNPAARSFVAADLLVVAGFAALILLAYDDFTAPTGPAMAIEAPPAMRLEQICSEQELRHMRAGIDACFDELAPGAARTGAPDRPMLIFAGS